MSNITSVGPSPLAIKTVVSEYMDCTTDELSSGKTDARIGHCRHVAMYVMDRVTDLNHASIGEEFGRTTYYVRNAIFTIDTIVKTVPEMAQSIDQMCIELDSHGHHASRSQDEKRLADQSINAVELATRATLETLFHRIREGADRNPSAVIGLINQLSIDVQNLDVAND